ncbi:MAG TPA: thioredoxin family protein [Actinoplanes sp.]|nr:thioredoxin family protein [Actinoplanes sp.]
MHLMGMVVAAAVLVLATAVGMWWRRSDGRLRPVGRKLAATAVAPGPAAASRSTAVSGLPGAPGPAGVDPGAVADRSTAGERIDPGLLVELGVRPAGATLLQFSSAFCTPCRAVRRVSGEVAAMIDGVEHVEVDAESHLAAVRALGIWRTPTLLVLDADGRVVRRATGVPAKPHLIAVLGEILAGR